MSDVKITIAPGQSKSLGISGIDYLYLKRALEPVVISLDQQDTTMEQGDNKTFARRLDGDSQVSVHNPSKITLHLVFDAGTGAYSRQVIEGELNVVPSVIRSDGTKHPDRRFWLNLDVNLDQIQKPKTVTVGDLVRRQEIASYLDGENNISRQMMGATVSIDGSRVLYAGKKLSDSGGLERYELFLRDFKTGDLISSFELIAPAGTGSKTGYLADLEFIDEATFLAAFNSGGTYIYDMTGNIVNGPILNLDMPIGGVTGYDPKQRIAIDHSAGVLHVTHAYNPEGSHKNLRSASYSFDAIAKTVGGLISESQHQQNNNLSAPLKPLFLPGYGFCSMFENSKELFVYDSQWNEVPGIGDTIDSENIYGNAYGGVALCYRNGELLAVESWFSGGNSSGRLYAGVREPKTGIVAAAGVVSDDLGESSHRLLESPPAARTFANITNTYIGSGKFSTAGEIIKGIVELYLGRDVEPDYLDHVFGLKISNTGSQPATLETYSGNYSFARVGNKDNFKIVLPGKISLFIEPELLGA